MKKYLLLMLCLVSSLVASAESGTCGANLTWSLEDGVLTISGTGAMANYNMGSPICSKDKSSISSIIINEGVTSIGEFAFSNYSNLSSVSIPNTVKEIGTGGFWECSHIETITLPNSVEELGGWVFEGCSSLFSFEIPESIKTIPISTFKRCSSLSNVVIPNSVTNIKNSAFLDCSSLASITIPNSVTSIEYSAFSGCCSLTSVTIGNSVTSIGELAFYDCRSLTSVTIPNSVTSIGNSAFYDCRGLTSISIPNSVTVIGKGAFQNCIGLTSMTIPNSVVSIGDGAFENCCMLRKDFTNNSNCTSKNNWGLLFYEIETPEGLLIDQNTAVACRPWTTSIIIPHDVTNIRDAAFSLLKLRNVKCKSAKCPKYGQNSFSSQTLAHALLYVPEGAWDNYAFDDSWYVFANIKEFAEEIDQVSATNAYTLMSPDFQYAVYDEVNDCVRMVAHQQMNEGNANTSWTLQTIDGNQYLYNIGAKKFATVDTKGAIELTEVPVAIQASNISEGVSLNENATPWNFVKNNNLFAPDNLGELTTSIQHIVRGTINTPAAYRIDGCRAADGTKPKGLYIQNGKKVLVY